MRFFDQFSRAASQAADAAAQAVERARFEAEKFHKTSRIQGELDTLKEQLDETLQALGQRTYDLYRAGEIRRESVTDLVQTIERLHIEVTRKEDELRIAQAEAYVENDPAASGPQSVPVDEDEQPHSTPHFRGQQPAQSAPPTQQPAQSAPPAQQAAQKKTCPACSFEMPGHAVFCPNCGMRVDTL
jgi:ElaB/YqjD/DUF883 family membrane-anchored ribosome-binding protein